MQRDAGPGHQSHRTVPCLAARVPRDPGGAHRAGSSAHVPIDPVDIDKPGIGPGCAGHCLSKRDADDPWNENTRQACAWRVCLVAGTGFEPVTFRL